MGNHCVHSLSIGSYMDSAVLGINGWNSRLMLSRLCFQGFIAVHPKQLIQDLAFVSPSNEHPALQPLLNERQFVATSTSRYTTQKHVVEAYVRM